MPATLLGQPHACNPTGTQAGPCLHMVSWLAFPMKKHGDGVPQGLSEPCRPLLLALRCLRHQHLTQLDWNLDAGQAFQNHCGGVLCP